MALTQETTEIVSRTSDSPTVVPPASPKQPPQGAFVLGVTPVIVRHNLRHAALERTLLGALWVRVWTGSSTARVQHQVGVRLRVAILKQCVAF